MYAPKTIINLVLPTLLIGGIAAQAVADTITPSVIFGVEDNGFDGVPDDFASASLADAIFTRFRDQRTFAEFDLSTLAGPLIQSATITGTLNEAFTFGFGTTPADFQFDLYAGNGAPDLSDFNIVGTTVGTITLQDDFDSAPLTLDVTAALQTLVDNGASFAGLRGLTTLANVGQVDLNDLKLEVVAVPEPATAALLLTAGLLALRRR